MSFSLALVWAAEKTSSLCGGNPEWEVFLCRELQSQRQAAKSVSQELGKNTGLQVIIPSVSLCLHEEKVIACLGRSWRSQGFRQVNPRNSKGLQAWLSFSLVKVRSHIPRLGTDSESKGLDEYWVSQSHGRLDWGSLYLCIFRSLLLPGSEELLGHALTKSVKKNLSVPK